MRLEHMSNVRTDVAKNTLDAVEIALRIHDYRVSSVCDDLAAIAQLGRLDRVDSHAFTPSGQATALAPPPITARGRTELLVLQVDQISRQSCHGDTDGHLTIRPRAVIASAGWAGRPRRRGTPPPGVAARTGSRA